jgi:hypothetical protein
METVQYAMKYVDMEDNLRSRMLRVLSFTADQALRLLPIFVWLLLVRGMSRFGRPAVATNVSKTPATGDAAAFLAIHAFGPLLIMIAMCLVAGLGLGMHWGTAYLWALPLWFLGTAAGARFANQSTRALLVGFVTIQALSVVQFVLTTP